MDGLEHRIGEFAEVAATDQINASVFKLDRLKVVREFNCFFLQRNHNPFRLTIFHGVLDDLVDVFL